MNTAKATKIAKSLGYGNVFVRANGEIVVNNKSGKAILTFNPDLSVKFQRWNFGPEAEEIKNALLESSTNNNVSTQGSEKRVDSGAGFYMQNTKKNWSLVNRLGFDAIEFTN